MNLLFIVRNDLLYHKSQKKSVKIKLNQRWFFLNQLFGLYQKVVVSKLCFFSLILLHVLWSAGAANEKSINLGNLFSLVCSLLKQVPWYLKHIFSNLITEQMKRNKYMLLGGQLVRIFILRVGWHIVVSLAIHATSDNIAKAAFMSHCLSFFSDLVQFDSSRCCLIIHIIYSVIREPWCSG